VCHCCLQPDINEKMRAILIDWLVEVHLKFKVSTCSWNCLQRRFACANVRRASPVVLAYFHLAVPCFRILR
jgi:hypothetical protein